MIWDFVIRFLWFYIAMGTLVSVLFWGRALLREKNRKLFTDDAAIHDALAKGEHDPVFLMLVDIFGSRAGVIILMFIVWPVALYLLIFQKRNKA